jgi:hypothetical protein
MSRFFLFINGILTRPEGIDGWQDRAVSYINGRGGVDHADRYEYACGAITRRIGQEKRVRECAELLMRANPRSRKVICSHSNGADICLRLLAEHPWIRVHELHLFAAAAEHDFAKNGLNAAFARGQVDRVVCYCSSADKALKAGRVTRKLFGFLGLGYGFLGLVGPENVAEEFAGNVETVWKAGYGHSDWLGKHFDEAMGMVTQKPEGSKP